MTNVDNPDLESLRAALESNGLSDALALWLASQSMLLRDLNVKISVIEWPASKIRAADELLTTAFDCRWGTFDCGCSGCHRRRDFLKKVTRKRHKAKVKSDD